MFFVNLSFLLQTVDNMQMYNAHIISCRYAIHPQTTYGSELTECALQLMYVHSVWTQTMQINSPLMQTVFIIGTCLIFEKFFKGIPLVTVDDCEWQNTACTLMHRKYNITVIAAIVT